MTTILALKTCSNCAHRFKFGKEIQCRLNPPIAAPIIANTNRGPQMVGQWNGFPIVQSDWRCGQHKQGLAVDMEEARATGELVT